MLGDLVMRGSHIWSIGLGATMVAVMPGAASAQVRYFDVPAQPATTGIPAFARQAGVQIVAPTEALAGIRTPQVKGSFDTQQALRRLIARSGLEIVSTSGNAIILRRAREQSTPSATDGAPSSDESAPDGDIDGDIVVTAQRRPERRQDVPVSLTAFGAKTIADYRLNRLEDVSRLTPGLLVSSFTPGRPVIAIRGATNTFNQIGVDKPVGVFVDDVYIARNSAATLELFGIDSIQVLRGPQGTLFGRNVTGGAIVIDTGRPSFDTLALVSRGSVGSYATRELDGIADIPLADGAAIRIGGLLRQHDGWGRDRLTGQELDDQDSKALRGQIRLRLTDRAEFLLGGDFADDRSGGRTLSSIGAGDDGDRRTAETGVPQTFRRKQGGVSGRLFWDTDVGELTSVTAWRRSRSTDIFSNVGTNYRFLTGTQSQALSDDRDNVSTVSQEIRLASPAWRLGNFVLGGYFSDEDSKRQLRNTALAAITGALVTNQLADQATSARSFALFADGTLNVTPVLSVSIGGRYTWDRKRAALTRTDFRAPANGFSVAGLESRWSQFTPRAVVKLQPMRDVMFYASYARGYTAGGYNTEAATLVALRTPFQPETVDNYEAGIKTEWFARRLRFNLTAFDMKYRNKQELFFNNLTRVLNITNASKATIKGIEADAAVRPADWLTLSATYGLLDTRYDAFVIPGGATLTGNRLGSSPHDKVSAAIDIRIPIGPGHVSGNVVYSHTSGYYTGAAKDPTLFVPGYSLVNGSLGYTTADDRFGLSVFVRNLFDKDYILIPSNQTVRSQYLGAPRIFGVTGSARF